MDRLWQVLLRVAKQGDGATLSCDDCFLILDCLSDFLAEGYAAEEILPIAEKYLRRCPDCAMENQAALRDLLAVLWDRAPAGGSRSTGSASVRQAPARPETLSRRAS